MKTSIRFDTAGGVACLYTEAVDLHALGRLHVVRATDIRFNDAKQRWEVRCAVSGQLMFADPSRSDCLAWEQVNLQPGSPLADYPSTRPCLKTATTARDG